MKLFSVLALMAACMLSFGQAGMHCSHHKSQSRIDRSATLSVEQIAQTEEYDVNFYFLDIEVNNTAVAVDGRTEIHATSRVADLDTFMIELHEDLNITDVLLNGTTSVPFTRVGSAVIVECSFTTDDAFYYEYIYDGIPPASGAGALGGGGMSNDFSGSWGNQVTWTLSEPFSAYEWFPCKQSLRDKADSCYVYITCDETCMAGSQGILKNVVDVGGGKSRYEWESQYPIDYYLISVAVAEYVDYSFYANPTGAAGPVLIQNFIYDNPATLPWFEAEIDLTGDFMEYYTELFGLYPFHEEKYGHCMAPFGGGMEHQTMTSQGWFESGLTAHEIAHQWFGNSVTCASWTDIWINEGFASYSEELMMEEFYPGDEITEMENRHSNIMSQPGGAVWVEDSLNASRVFSGRLTYNKGAAIVHTLRFLIDDDVTFFNILQTFQVVYKDSTATGEDFKDVAEFVGSLSLDAFFNEWYYGEGYPTYNLTYNRVGSTVFVEVDQDVSMASVTPFFTNDLELKITGVGGTEEIVRLSSIDGTTSLHSFAFPEEIDEIEIDPNNWIINQNGTITSDPNLVGIDDIEEVGLDIFPNPTKDLLNIHSNASISYIISNALGQEITNGIFIAGNNQIDLSGYEYGIYLISVGAHVYKVVKE